MRQALLLLLLLLLSLLALGLSTYVTFYRCRLRGERIGHAFEDAIKLSLILSYFKSESPKTAFEFYEKLQCKKTDDM